MSNRVACISEDIDLLNLCKISFNEAGCESRVFIYQDKEKEKIKAELTVFSPEIIFVSYDSQPYFTNSILPNFNSSSKKLYAILLLNANQKAPDKIFSLGFVGYVPYPVTKQKIISAISQINAHIKSERKKEETIKKENLSKKNLTGFLFTLSEKKGIKLQYLEDIIKEKNNDIYALKDILGMDENEIAIESANYLEKPFFEIINPDDILNDILPIKFSKNNLVATLKKNDEKFIIFPNHFDQEILTAIAYLNLENFKSAVASPKILNSVLHLHEEVDKNSSISVLKNENEYLEVSEKVIRNKIENAPVIYITNKLIESAISAKASDMHLEPKETYYSLRFRIDGDLREFTKLKKETGNMSITRLKALSNLDIAERRKPQDGSFSVKKEGKKYTIRISTSSTGNGESAVARIIDNEAKPKKLSELGMFESQVKTMDDLSKCTQGIVLIAAPTGSGKTTTIYSFISSIDLDKKSLITVEDPVEYKIQKAVQQQINEKAGVTFSNLLKASVRQDPDILFLGEVRDEESARIAFDFSSTGHLTISTIHTANATSAIFRLERFLITRSQIAETVLALISQRLIKKLCPYCKKKVKTSREQISIAKKFDFVMPDEIYEAVGCPKCYNSGYSGRLAVYEIVRFTPEISQMIAENKSILEIRQFLKSKNVILMPSAALMKCSEGVFDFNQIYERILAEELKDTGDSSVVKNIESSSNTHRENKVQQQSSLKDENGGKHKILIVDDDADLLGLLSKILISNGYDIDTAQDGLDAIVKIAKNTYDLVISDLDMPNLNGLKLVEAVNSKNLGTSIMLLTATTDENAEQKALEFGAVDYIRKPFKKDVLLLRIKKALSRF